MLSELFGSFEWHQVRLGAAANPPKMTGPGVVIFAAETFDDKALEIKHSVRKAAAAPNAVGHALTALKHLKGHVAFVALISDANKRDELVRELQTAIARRG